MNDPFDPEVSLAHTPVNTSVGSSVEAILDAEQVIDRAVEGAVVRALFNGNDFSRRNFMKLVGSSAAMSIVASFFPLDAAKAWAKEAPGPLEKKDLKIGFIPITCATPIIMADPLKIL